MPSIHDMRVSAGTGALTSQPNKDGTTSTDVVSNTKLNSIDDTAVKDLQDTVNQLSMKLNKAIADIEELKKSSE